MAAVAEFRRPESVLVVVHTPVLDCLLLERVEPRGFWQSVTGTLRWAETPAECAARELAEETGLAPLGLRDAHVQRSFPILPAWRSRYAPGVDRTSSTSGISRCPTCAPCRSSRPSTSRICGLPIEAAIEKVASWTNREALQRLEGSRAARDLGRHRARPVDAWRRDGGAAPSPHAERDSSSIISLIRRSQARWRAALPRSRNISTAFAATRCTSSATASAAC